MSEIGKAVGKRVRELRLQRKLSQEGLGELARLSYKFIGEIERGVANPTLDTLDRIADALRIDLADLVRSTYEPRTLSPADYLAVQEVRESVDQLMNRFKTRSRVSKKSR